MISMDQLTCIVDDGVELDDEVVLLGEQGEERVTADELAHHAETIGYETVCATALAARRGTRVYLNR
jgi:alanine racemase